MMKKIFSKYFVVAVVAVAMGCISSCKDFEDEMYSELKGQDVALKADLDAQIGKLRQEMKDSVQKAREEREALQTALNNHIAYAEATYATKAELAAEKATLEQQIAAGDATLQTKLNATNARIDSLNNELNTKIIPQVTDAVRRIGEAEGRLTTLEKDYAKIAYVDDEIQKVKDMFADYYKKAEADAEFVDNDELQAALKDLMNNQEATEAITQIINQQFYGDAGATGTPIANLSELRALAEKADETATANAASIATMQELINQIKQCNCPVLVDRVEALENKMDSIEKVCKELEDNFAVLESRVDTLSGIETTKALANQAQEKAEQFAKEYTDKALDAILAYVNPRFTSIEEMMAEFYNKIENQADQLLAHDADIAALKDSVNLLRADLTSLEERVAKNAEDIAALTEKVQNVEDALKNRISSIVLQATKSPVIGYFNMPMGIKSNVLAAYYGEAMNDVYFPTVRTANLISGAAFTEKEAELLGFTEEMLYGQGDVLIDEAEGNAGTLYVTINPAEVDTTGVDFALVNSLDESSYVTLGEFTPSKEKLTFGYTRAGNGFYEAKATISAENAANAKIRVKFDDVKELASELKSVLETQKVDFLAIASSLQNIINDVADANAVKASWTDKIGDHNVYSEYSLATMTVKPFSYQFMNTFHKDNIWGISRISNFIDRIIGSIKIDMPEISMKNFTIEKIHIDNYDSSKGTVNVFVPELDKTITLNLGDAYGDFYIDVTKPIEEINKELEFLEKDLNNLLEQLYGINDVEKSIIDAKKDLKNELNKYLEKLNNRLCNVVNSINERLQPCLLLKTTDGLAMLSQVKNMPTSLTATNCIVVPTSYTGEYLVPAFKKYVAVTNVFDGDESAQDGCADCIAALEAANSGDLNKVLAGTTNAVEFAGKSGYTYEITYSALDYSGKYSNVKYYVTVK